MDNEMSNLLEKIDPDNNDFMENFINFESYNLDNFEKSCIDRSNSFNILHHNSRSISREGRLEDYDIMLDSIKNPFHVLAFTETWLNNGNVNQIEFEGYEAFHCLRQDSNDPQSKDIGGGISVFIREGIKYKIHHNMNVSLSHTETLFVEVNFDNKKYLIGIIYRVPNTNLENFLDTINSLIEPVRGDFELVLMGDFNVCLLRDNNYSSRLTNCMMSNNLIPTILEPTRVSNVIRDGKNTLVESLIDNIFINTQSSLVNKSGLIQSSISDHYPVFLSMKSNSKFQKEDVKIIKYRSIDDFSIRKFKVALKNSFQSIFSQSLDAPSVFKAFYSQFQVLYDKYFPIKTKIFSRKSLLKPWVSPSLVKRIKIRDRLLHLANKGRIDRVRYTDFRNMLNNQLREAKASYFDNKFNDCYGNIKKMWDIINCTIKKRHSYRKVSLCDDGILVNSDEIPNKFSNYFSNIADQLVTNIPDGETNVNMYLRNRQVNTFFMSKITSKDIEQSIGFLKRNGCGLYNYSTEVLDNIKFDISEILADIFNLCIDEGYFPDELKIGCITPVHKAGDKTDISNYRPICSLSPFSKIFEKIIQIKMLDFIEKYNIFSTSQFGFRKGYSTETALLKFVDFVHGGLTNKHNVGTIFMDLSKAYDIMDHSIIEIKLEHYGFRGIFLKFLMNFLENRKYFVSTNGLTSDTKTINIGVPQGATLSPLLFLLYVNDMRFSSKFLEFIQFADDTTLLYSCKDFDFLQLTLEKETKKVIEWLSTNKLIVNLKKTHVMLFSYKKNLPKLTIKINNIELDEKTVTKFLGVYIDNKMNWKPHVVNICNKVSKSVAILRLVRTIFPLNVLKTIYMSLVYTYMNYCNLIWGAAEKGIVEPLFKLQKKALRIITRSHYLAHTEPLFKNLKLLTIYQVYSLNCSIFIFKCMKGNLFPQFKSRMAIGSQFHDHNTRGKEMLRLKFRARLRICQRSFLNNGVNMWNSLDSNMKNSNSVGYFKKMIKHNLIM